MLGKLLKNELKSYRFSFGIIFLTAFLVTLFMKFTSMLPYQRDVREVIQVFTAYGYYYIIMIANVAALVLAVVQFYSTMVGDRGYLTWTLPASSVTHIWVKLIGATLMRILAGVVTVVLMLFFYSGRYWVFYSEITSDMGFSGSGNFIVEIFRAAFWDLFGGFEAKYILTIFIVLLIVLFSLILPMLLLYMCIAIGQLFGKWRILASVGCYFGIMILLQILMVVGMVVLAVGSTGITDTVQFTYISDYAAVNLVLVFILLVEAAGAAVLFAVTNWIFKKHLNLE